MFDNTDHGVDLLCSSLGILNRGLEVEIHNVVVIVCDVWLVAVHSQLRITASQSRGILQSLEGKLPAKGSDFDRHGTRDTQSRHELGIINNNDKFLGLDLDHLFAQQGATTSLDQVQVGINLIGTIDSDVQHWMRIEGDQRDLERLCLLLGSDRGRNRDDIFQFAGLELLAESFHGIVRSGSRTEADDHARRNIIIDGLVSDNLFELFDIGRHGDRSGSSADLGTFRVGGGDDALD
mmetsp:Transcript_17823/g.30974  ORF Transcript_17823/g.30974 Transcript_17823/m.30974 type:complete len:236 (+) Transcript_17823:163-870(+)